MATTLKTRSEGRQSILVARASFTHADINGTDFIPALELPADAVILRASMAITTAFSGGTISVGTSGAPAGHLAATSAIATGITSMSLPIDGDLLGAVTEVGITSSAAQSAGEGALVYEYIRAGRSQVTQG